MGAEKQLQSGETSLRWRTGSVGMRDEASHIPEAGERGFTLIEVLVALTILAVSLTVLFGIFGHSLARNAESRSRMAASNDWRRRYRSTGSFILAFMGVVRPDALRPISPGASSARPYGTDEDQQSCRARRLRFRRRWCGARAGRDRR